ncbi:prepilin peptidase [Kineococcus radiotolerans]|uniref:prepilin peptidase n=1 Tax=Kineococcus radiotolerans TaxID=131568 RepID=UPI0023AF2926|nr:A24 family peptidase [Kineococcus radiotolerans]
MVGVLVGSFLNVVVHRVPSGESVVAPASRCPVCGHAIRRRDNVPILSWLFLRGRCRDCGAPVSVRYPLVEGGTGLVFAVVALRVGPVEALPAYLYLAALAVALALIDVDVHRLPDAIVKPAYPVSLLLLVTATALTGEWSRYVHGLIGGAGLLLLYFLLYQLWPGGMGFGDVKLAGVLGLYLGWWGWEALVVGAFAAFLLGGIVGVGVLLTRRGGRKSRIPFGPFMLAGAWLALLFAQPVVDWYLSLFGITPSA